jgi:large subunit ribosomal protein L25
MIPLHFTNEQDSPGVRAGGLINHTMTQVEVRCQAKDLPEFIEVDMMSVEMNDVVHLSNLKLPKGVQLTVDLTDSSHDAPVLSIHAPKKVSSEEETNIEEESSSAKPEDDQEENKE